MPSFSSTLEQSIHAALAYSNSWRHELSTLEHLLWSLTSEPSAAHTMANCGVDLVELRNQLQEFVADELRDLVSHLKTSEAVPTAAFQRVIQRAAIHVQSSGRTEVVGANVLVAIFAERESNAAFFLQEQGMSRYDAVNFMAHKVAKTEQSVAEVEALIGEYEAPETPSEALLDELGALNKPDQETEAQDQRDLTARSKERKTVVTKLVNNSVSLSLQARVLELLIEEEIENLQNNKPNFETDSEKQRFERQIEFLVNLRRLIGSLAENIARIDQSDNEHSETVADDTITLKEQLMAKLNCTEDQLMFHGIRMPAMLATIALFSAAGANMIVATPALMTIYGGEKIIKILKGQGKTEQSSE